MEDSHWHQGENVRFPGAGGRSEEHTSELQSHRDLHSFPTRRSSDLMNSMHHAVSLQTMRSSGRGGTHHVRQAAMGTADQVYNFIQRLLAAGFQAQWRIRIGIRERT